MNPLNIRTHLKPGVCKTRRCKGKPRDLRTHPNSHQHCGSCAKKLWRMRNPVSAAYDNLRASARKRKIPFTLTLSEWRDFILPTRYMDESGCERFRLHVDRLDVTRGYEKGNLQILTCSENVAKGNRERHVAEKIDEWSNHKATEEEPF